ncbi:MAG: aconitate hydratase AcnA [Roseiflexaceae bacterium]
MSDGLIDVFGARAPLKVGSKQYVMYRLDALQNVASNNLATLPFSVKVVLEALLRNIGDGFTSQEDVEALAKWTPASAGSREVAFKPARVLMQDFTGVPAVVDLAAMRDAMKQLGGDPSRINPLAQADLVIDHSVQVDAFGHGMALQMNADLEFSRNRERYEFLRWGQQSFTNFSVVPPETGICHQVNLEYLAKGVLVKHIDGEAVAMPDSLVGTDSHTTMINGLGVLGWGVGGIEAEAVLLGQPLAMLTPEVVGMRLMGKLAPGATATDLVLRVTEMLRKHGVVDKFVEFCGDGLSALSLADRATIANMAPEYGATCGFFPIDDETLKYLRGTGRTEDEVALVEAYAKAQGMFRVDGMAIPAFNSLLELDLSTIEPSVAGPRRPQDRVALKSLKVSFNDAMSKVFNKPSTAVALTAGAHNDTYPDARVALTVGGVETSMTHGSAVIAAITSCTNTSNPSVMMAAGLLAQKAVARGLTRKPYVKTSLAPGSRVVSEYLKKADVQQYLDQLGFNVIGYGCTTCIGNSGPVDAAVSAAAKQGDLVVSAVLSGNRNFEGRIHPIVKANYLMSPPLVVAFAIAGTVDIDMNTEPLGIGSDGNPVYLADIWPSEAEINEALHRALSADLFRAQYANVFTNNKTWNELPVPQGDLYTWNSQSTYVQNPPYFRGMTKELPKMQSIRQARALAVLGDNVTTDHISPAGDIPKNSPAGIYLEEHDVAPADFNSYGARRGNHEVMMRGTFANIRLKNAMVPGVEGGYTVHIPSGTQMSIYDAAMQYEKEQTPLVVLAGKEYGMGSSRDWAAKGTFLLGVRAVIAESFERIHRSNLVGMGVLPLTFEDGQNAASLGLTGRETFEIEGIESLQPGQTLMVKATLDGKVTSFAAKVRINSEGELNYYRNGGILHYVLRSLASQNEPVGA